MRLLNIFVAMTVALSSIAIASPVISSPPNDPVQAAKTAVRLDKQSIATLGVSIQAVGLLMQTYHSQYDETWRKDALLRDGLMPRLRELEKNGYVKSSVVVATSGEEASLTGPGSIKITVTDKGKAVANALRSGSGWGD